MIICVDTLKYIIDLVDSLLIGQVISFAMTSIMVEF